MTRQASGEPSTVRIAATALLVAAGYYAGANLGLILRLPPETPSVMWPPNAILTAALLLAPPRRWWLYLLAAFPAHLAAIPAGWMPVPMMVTVFLTNCSEAVVGAALVHLLSDAPARVDTLWRISVFILGAAL